MENLSRKEKEEELIKAWKLVLDTMEDEEFETYYEMARMMNQLKAWMPKGEPN